MGLTRPRAHQLQDLDYKQAVRAISTSNVSLTGGAPATVDGVALDFGDRILVTGQTSASENGIYQVDSVGAGSNGTWTRTATADEDGEINAGLSVFVTEGTVYGDTQWLLTTDDPITVDVTDLSFTQMQGAPGNSFATIAVAEQSNIIADTQADTLTFASGNNIVLTTNAGTDTLTVSANDTPNFTSVTTSSLIKTGSNGIGNIGQSDNAFDTVFAKATSAQYADLAEKYESDRVYEPGTVLIIGGAKEVTASNTYADSSIAGVVSTAPAYIMNASIEAEISVEVALTGRVPCKVLGNINKGDLLTSSKTLGVATVLDVADFKPGCVIGKALENYNSISVGVIEVLVGKN